MSEARAEVREFREQNTRVLNAMRQDLTDFRSEVRSKFAEVDNGFAEMRGRLDTAAAGQQEIVGLLNTLIAQAEDQ